MSKSDTRHTDSKDELQDAIKFIAHHIWLHGNNVGKHPEAYKNIASEKVDELRYGQKFINDLITAEVRKAEDAQTEKDLAFLREMKTRLGKAATDTTEYDYLETMINDWIVELAALKAERNGREKA